MTEIPPAAEPPTEPPAHDGSLSWDDLVREAKSRLTEALGGQRGQEARWIVERVSGYTASELVLNSDERVSVRSVAFFDQLINRRCAGEPLQYVLGRWSFRTLELAIDRNVLIPRPETEVVAGLAITLIERMQQQLPGPKRIVDLGTGSGAIALSCAAELTDVDVWATDVSPAALRVARANLAGLGRAGQRVIMCEGSWYEALPQELLGTIDVIVSNPPYVARTDEVPTEVTDWEPHLALYGPGEYGNEFIATIIEGASAWLKPTGALVIEMQPNQTEWAQEHAVMNGFSDASVEWDLADKPRALIAWR